MEYQPRQDREIRESMVLTPGEYDFEVVEAVEKVSKAGNDMIELKLRIFVPDGSTRLLNDWLVPGSDLGDLKLNRFAHATGLQDAYFAGELSSLNCTGAAGKVRLTVQADEKYGDQSRVKDYVVPTQTDDVVQHAPPDDYNQDVPRGVPPQQTKRALVDKYEDALKAGGDDVPF
jgi:hypothetical protein